ncbi:Imm49 family immunity protein [Moritella sp.]|uniref:Imm49 family immunity protein n=1 Tax=Moritella sp. TaxID=78556 RepID=UPI001D6C2DF8|nr:Imm49 family immunity protein [Moritella sp.]MCJ8351393.1 immunity 49 family protein [Moritella sp.]NQZ40224.1 immunity 49 family protein [Moritella sp.]
MTLIHHRFNKFDTLSPSIQEGINSDYVSDIKNWERRKLSNFNASRYRNLCSVNGLQALIGKSYLLNKPKTQIMRNLYTFPESGMLGVFSQLHEGKKITLTLEGHSCEVVADNIISKPYSSGKINGFNLAFAELCKGMFNPYADMRKLRDKVVEASAHFYVEWEEQKEYVNHLYLPLVELICVVHSAERESHYQSSLLHALQAHKAYYDNEDRSHDAEAMIALCITGIAAYAYDRFGLVPEVETDYMPQWLVKGEFPTYDEAFPEIKALPKPICSDFEFTAEHLPRTQPESRHIYEAALKWAKEERELPPLCDVIGRDIDSKQINKNIVGEIFIEVLGDDWVLTLYSMEPSLIQDPQAWLAAMTTRWQAFIAQFSQEAITNVRFIEYD